MATETERVQAMYSRFSRGEVLRIMMFLRGFRQQDVAARANVHRSTVNLLLADSPSVSDELAERVAEGCGCISGRLTRFARSSDAS